MTLLCKLFVGSHQKDIGEIEIANVTRDPSRMSSDYVWRINTLTGADKPVHAVGYIVDSVNSSAVDLLYEVLAQWKSGRDYCLDNHGYSRDSPEGINVSAAELWKRLDTVKKQ